MVWSATSMTTGVELDFAIAGEVLQKGSAKFVGLRKIQDDSFLPDDLRRQAPLLDHAPEARVACTTVFLIDADDREWKNARD
jgi:hypothetical protein